MKMTTIQSINDVLAYLLHNLNFRVVKIVKVFSPYCESLSSRSIRDEWNGYAVIADAKKLKIERIFNYLMKVPLIRTGQITDVVDHETRLTLSVAPNLKDVLTSPCIRDFNAYKIADCCCNIRVLCGDAIRHGYRPGSANSRMQN